ncbi:MAG: energy transducer TonB [Sulfuritalea sp.]|nr:energy transducer TonB [Sulfuritalea sp.]
MNHKISIEQWSKLSGLAMVLALHGALLYAAMSYKLIPPPQEAVTLFVNLINPPKKVEPPPEPPKLPPKKVTLVKPQPVLQPKPEPLLVSNAPVVAVNEPVAPPPPVVPAPPAPEPVVEAPVKPATVTLSSDLSVSCPQRAMPNYPAASRRLNEQGLVVLRVELDETGHITSARVETSSGYKRLDEAGLAIVKTWHCNAATREGKAVRAVALQPFDFILEGR